MFPRNIFISIIDFSMQYLKLSFGKHMCFTLLLIISVTNFKLDLCVMLVFLHIPRHTKTHFYSDNEPPMVTDDNFISP